jgi:hypothetical protein
MDQLKTMNDFIRLATVTIIAGLTIAHISSRCAADPAVLFQSDGQSIPRANSVIAMANVSGFNQGIGPELQVGTLPGDWGLSTINAHTGNTAIRFSGSATGGSATFCCRYAYSVSIPVSKTTKLSYWIYPQQLNATMEKVDLHCTDGTTLHSLGGVYSFVDTTAPYHIPGQIPINAWSKISVDAGKVLAGKTIDAVWIVYDNTGSNGQFRGYIDDIFITDNNG